MWRQFIFEGAVAVRTFAEIVTVNPNLTVAIDSVEFDEDEFSFLRGGDRKRLAIPADAAGQRAAASAGRVLLAELTFNAPVVWQIKLSPLRIAQSEEPILIERDSFSGTRIRKANCCREKK